MRSSKEKVVRKRLADGSVREYRYPRNKPPAPRYAPDSVNALIAAYGRSPEWAALRPATLKLYKHYLKGLELIGHVRVCDVRRKSIVELRNAIAVTRGNGAGTGFMKAAGAVFAWAVNAGWLDHSPAARIQGLPGGHLAAWSAAEADHATANLAEPLRRAVILARYTGQRRGDLVTMTWRAYDGRTIRLKQQKTGVTLVIPAHPTLRAELDRWKREGASTHILVAPNGLPWKPDRLTQVMGEALPKIGLRAELNMHGLRKLAATALADAGCSTHEIAAVTGHRSLAMVALYTASADQEKLAKAAIVRMENAAQKAKEG